MILGDKRADGQVAFTVFLYYLDSNLEPEGVELEINRNPGVGRYQEFAYDEEPMYFVDEKPSAEP